MQVPDNTVIVEFLSGRVNLRRGARVDPAMLLLAAEMCRHEADEMLFKTPAIMPAVIIPPSDLNKKNGH